MLLIVGAFEPEVEPIREALAATSSSSTIELMTCGVGSIAAAATLASYLSSLPTKPSGVVFVGSVGALDPRHKVGTIVSSSHVRFIDPNALTGDAYVPSLLLDKHVSPTVPVLEHVASQAQVPQALVYSPPSITATEALAHRLAQSQLAQFENLELFGVATACAQFALPWLLFSAVTNTVGLTAHETWKRSYKECAVLTAQSLILALQKGA